MRAISIAMLALVLGVFTAGCAKEEGPMEKMGKDVDQAVKDVEDAAEDIADDVKDAAEG
jgi:outer membrane lipoprotein-sorting protein